MEYEEIKLLKKNEKSTIHLVKEINGERIFVKKELWDKYDIYLELEKYPHPYLPKLYEVTLADGRTTIIEEYIEDSF